MSIGYCLLFVISNGTDNPRDDFITVPAVMLTKNVCLLMDCGCVFCVPKTYFLLDTFCTKQLQF